MSAMGRESLVEAMLAAGISPSAVAQASERAARTGEDLASAALGLKVAPERDLVRVLAALRGYPGVDLSQSVVCLSNLLLIPEDLIRSRLVLPVMDAGGEMIAAMADPDDREVFDQLRFLTGRRILRHIAVTLSLRQAIDGAFKLVNAGEHLWRGREAWNAEPPPEGRAAVVRPPPGPAQVQATPGPLEGLPLQVRPGQVPEARWLDAFLSLGGPSAVGDPAKGAPAGAQLPPRSVHTALTPTYLRIDALGAGKTVLVVDDDPDLRSIEAKLLAPLGCAVVQATDGKEGLALARELSPDAMILDAMLPGMHGFEVCRAVKGDPALRRTGIIMVSGIYTGWRVGVDLKEVYGADFFFAKPFRVEEVSRAVRTLLLGAPEAEALALSRRQEVLALCKEAQGHSAAGRPAEAAAMLQTASQKDPFSAEPHYYLAQILRSAGQPYQAIAALERAVELRPDLDQPVAQLGELYLELGFRKTAREVFLKAASVCRDPGRLQQIQQRLAQLDPG